MQPSYSTSGVTSLESDQWTVKVGTQGLIHEWADGSRLFFGVRGHYGQSFYNVRATLDDGSINTNSYGIGSSLTWFDANGTYVDLQAKATWSSSDISSASTGSLVDDNKGFGYGLSAEIGRSISLDKNWAVTPQAQLSFASVNFDQFTGSSSEIVSIDGVESLKVRLGVSADRDFSWKTEKGNQRTQLHVIGNVLRDFKPVASTQVSGETLTIEREKWTGEVGVGFTRSFNDDAFSLYGDMKVSTDLESFGDSYAAKASLGVRVNF